MVWRHFLALGLLFCSLPSLWAQGARFTSSHPPVEPIRAVATRPPAATPDRLLQGLELEYALKEDLPSNAPPPAEAAYLGVFDEVNKIFPLGSASSTRKIRYGREYLSFEARNLFDGSWNAVPECCEGQAGDGVELVSPPFRTRAGIQKLARVHQALLNGGRYRRGIYSAAHYTVDVSHLVTANGDASRLVDAILFIESNWKPIFAAVDPSVFSTIVNHFAVPLAVDHAELLRELAALPRAQRTFEQVRGIFAKYDDAEREAFHGDYARSWKFRAANYGKLFGLQDKYQNKALRVIEFRVADLPEPERLAPLADLFVALVKDPPPQDSFQSPFQGGRTFPELNEQIRRQDRGAYLPFLRQLGLDPSQFPFPDYSQDVTERAARAVGLPPPSSPDWNPSGLRERRFLVASLRGLDPALMVSRGLELLDDPDYDVRIAAIDLLQGFTPSFPRLALQRLANAPLRFARWRAAAYLLGWATYRAWQRVTAPPTPK